jgi:hypothetical protein
MKITFLLAALTACAAPGMAPSASASCGNCSCGATAFPETQSKLQQDRRAILAMAGEYKVSFRFVETVPLVAGYESREPKVSGATEFVDVIVDEPGHIELQHVLVMGEGDAARVVKHWRQAWRYEDEHLTTYRGHNTWETRALSPEERDGRWTQFVYQVDDSPRYEGIGEWVHEGGTSTWESEPTWRPLPRREHTTRDDYHVMACVNRHTITPTGWTHEQDNEKVVLTDTGEVDRVLVREAGLNVYDHLGKGIAAGETHDFSAGRDYWSRTAPFWSDVRDAWDARFNSTGRVQLRDRVEGRTLWQHMFAYARNLVDAQAYDAEEGQVFIAETLEAFELDEAVAAR